MNDLLGGDIVEYVLTERGLIIPIILPLEVQIMILIDIQSHMLKKIKTLIAFGHYLFGIISVSLLYMNQYGNYLCFIWGMMFLIGYPVLYIFFKLGDLTNQNLSKEEKIVYKKLSDIFTDVIAIFGFLVMILAFSDEFWGMIAKNLEFKIIALSKMVYVTLGLLCIARGLIYKKSSLWKNNS